MSLVLRIASPMERKRKEKGERRKKKEWLRLFVRIANPMEIEEKGEKCSGMRKL